MTAPDLPNEEANQFLKDLRHSAMLRIPAETRRIRPASDDLITKPLQRIVGILDDLGHDGRRKIYHTSTLDEGVEIFDAAILFYRKLPPNPQDGLEYDVVWVDTDADIISFSRRRSPNRDPGGGTGLPPESKSGGGGFPGI